MMAQWENKCISQSVLPMAWFNSQPWRSISREISLADHTLPTHPESAWQKRAQSPLDGTTQPVDIEEKGRNPTTADYG